MSSIDFTSFLKLMAHQKASDLFITAGMPPAMKVNGKISPITQAPLTPQQSRDLVLNVMTPSQREEFEKTHECNFAIGVSGVGRFRVSCFYQRNQVGMVLRRIETRIPTVEELNLPPIIKSLAMTKRGIIIFVGATGTGKSTSLAAMIGYRNQNSTGHIITIEDPIEFVHKHEGCIITQREVGIDTDSWENALKNTLRQAPDVIMIGEVRTREAWTTRSRSPRPATWCCAPCMRTTPTRRWTASSTSSRGPPQPAADGPLAQPQGRGRAATDPHPGREGAPRGDGDPAGHPLVQDYIRDGEIHKLKDVMKESVQLGMKTFDQSLFELYQAGEIGYEDALRYADSANEVRLRIKLARGGDAATLAQGLDGVEVAERLSGRAVAPAARIRACRPRRLVARQSPAGRVAGPTTPIRAQRDPAVPARWRRRDGRGRQPRLEYTLGEVFPADGHRQRRRALQARAVLAGGPVHPSAAS